MGELYKLSSDDIISQVDKSMVDYTYIQIGLSDNFFPTKFHS